MPFTWASVAASLFLVGLFVACIFLADLFLAFLFGFGSGRSGSLVVVYDVGLKALPSSMQKKHRESVKQAAVVPC
jgi:hypothetical protein